MKVKQLPLAIIAVILMFSACKKPPEASFTHSSDSYEVWDTINFASTSTDAADLDWDFGDGSISTEEAPFHIYDETGTFEVKLTATNDDGSDETSESITIKDPTILGFWVTEGSSETSIPNCTVMIFENQSDWENFENIADAGYTDTNGEIYFYHVKGQVYFVWAIKEVSNGTWGFGGSTGANTLNDINLWVIPCEFATTKKSDRQLPPEEIKTLKRIGD